MKSDRPTNPYTLRHSVRTGQPLLTVRYEPKWKQPWGIVRYAGVFAFSDDEGRRHEFAIDNYDTGLMFKVLNPTFFIPEEGAEMRIVRDGKI